MSVDVAACALARRAAMLDFEQGKLPDADARLTANVGQLQADGAPLARRELIDTLIERATVRRYANRWGEALADLNAAVDAAAALPPFPRRAAQMKALHTRAKLLATEGTPVRDLDRSQRDLAALRGLGFEDWFVDELECELARQRRQWAVVAEKSARVATHLRQEGWAAGVAFAGVRTATAWLELGEPDRAESALREPLAFLTAHGPPDQLAQAQLTAARIAAARGNGEDAWSLAARSLDGIDALIRHFRALADQHRFVADKLRYYRHAFDIALAGGGDRALLRAWSVAERAKSFYLCQLVANAEVPLFDGVPRELPARLRALEDELDALERTLAADRTRADRAQALRAERNALYGEAMRANPRWAALHTPPALDMAALLPRWTTRHTLASFFWRADDQSDPLGAAQLHLFFNARDGTPRHCVSGWTGVQRRALDAAREALDTRGASDPFLPALPPDLGPRLWPDELVAQLREDATLLISPHGVLGGLALHAARLPGERRLIDLCPVQYAPTFALLAAPARARGAGTGVLLLGCEQDGFGSPALPDVTPELDALAAQWPGARPIVIGPTETPAARGAGIGAWTNARLIHVACHGSFDGADPLDAALLLGADKLRAAEFFGARLTADLVILSACDVGRRAHAWDEVVTAFDEWLGLYLPLFYAGARALVVSRWQANSAKARMFMQRLHECLAAGDAPAAAMRTAGLSMGRARDVFWANWALVGVPPLSEEGAQR